MAKGKDKEIVPVDYTTLSTEELIAALQKKDQDIAVLEEVNKELMERNGDLDKTVKESGNRPTVKVDGKTYAIRCNHTNWKGVVVSAEDIQNDKKIAEEMVKEGSKLLIEKK